MTLHIGSNYLEFESQYKELIHWVRERCKRGGCTIGGKPTVGFKGDGFPFLAAELVYNEFRATVLISMKDVYELGVKVENEWYMFDSCYEFRQHTFKLGPPCYKSEAWREIGPRKVISALKDLYFEPLKQYPMHTIIVFISEAVRLEELEILIHHSFSGKMIAYEKQVYHFDVEIDKYTEIVKHNCVPLPKDLAHLIKNWGSSTKDWAIFCLSDQEYLPSKTKDELLCNGNQNFIDKDDMEALSKRFTLFCNINFDQFLDDWEKVAKKPEEERAKQEKEGAKKGQNRSKKGQEQEAAKKEQGAKQKEESYTMLIHARVVKNVQDLKKRNEK